MPTPSPLIEKSYTFAIQIVHFSLEIQQRKKEYVLTKQVLKSGTSIGANIEEATQAQSKDDFISKLSIALKEAHETRYWLRLIRDTKLADTDATNKLIKDVHEIIKMLVASIKTAKKK